MWLNIDRKFSQKFTLLRAAGICKVGIPAHSRGFYKKELYKRFTLSYEHPE